MKKTLSLVLALTLVLTLAFSMVACGGKDNAKDTDNGTDDAVVDTNETPADTDETPADTDETPADTDETPADTDETPADTDETPVDTDEVPADTDETPDNTDTPSVSTGSLAILEKIWAELSDDYKPFVFGGFPETPVDGAPGNYGVENADAVDNSLGFPAASINLIDEAASVIHAMNANTFTMAAYHVADAANLEAAVKAIEDNLAGRHWMCGFPDVLSIITIDGEYVISMFGAGELVNGVEAQVKVSYPQAVVSVHKSLAE